MMDRLKKLLHNEWHVINVNDEMWNTHISLGDMIDTTIDCRDSMGQIVDMWARVFAHELSTWDTFDKLQYREILGMLQNELRDHTTYACMQSIAQSIMTLHPSEL